MSAYALKIMSFNLRVDNAGDGINSFTNRFARIIEVILRESPDIIGFQEVTDRMRARLRDHIPGYTVVGCGREKNCHGESMLIAYRTAEVEVISMENVWLSHTPTIPGSTFGGDQSSCPRMYTSLLLKHDRIARPFRFINTHLDHCGKTARMLGATQLVQMISAEHAHVVLTGDFNATPDAPEIQLITGALAARGLIDCTASLGGTFHDFGRCADSPEKIDYIFSDGLCQDAYMVEDIPVDGQYYSDHNAVCALISLEEGENHG